MYAGRVVSDFRHTVGYIRIHMIRGGFANTDIACKMCWLVVSNIRINGRYKRCWAKVTMFILAAGCYGTRKCFGTSFGWAALPRGIMQRKQMQCIHVFIFWIFDLEDYACESCLCSIYSLILSSYWYPWGHVGTKVAVVLWTDLENAAVVAAGLAPVFLVQNIISCVVRPVI